MTPSQLRTRTRQFAIDVIRFSRRLPRTDEARVIKWQLLRAGTSVGANYRAACRAKSDADFAFKIGTCLEESDEAGYWLELLDHAGILDANALAPLVREADELTRIFVSSRETVRARIRKNKGKLGNIRDL